MGGAAKSRFRVPESADMNFTDSGGLALDRLEWGGDITGRRSGTV